jgi:chromatin remodeling complex protein RSC6
MVYNIIIKVKNTSNNNMANAALSQKLTPSSTLAKIIGSSTVTRGEAVKKL